MFCVSMGSALASDGRAPRENPCFSVVLNDIIRQNIDRRVADQSRDSHFRGVPVMPRFGMRHSHVIGAICWLGWMLHLCVAVASLAAVVQSCSFEGSARFATLSFQRGSSYAGNHPS